MRKIFKIVRTEVVITSDEEYAQLRGMIDARKPNLDNDQYGELIHSGTAIEVTTAHGGLDKGQIVIVSRDSFADSDGDYPVWYVSKDDDLTEGYVRFSNAKRWHPGEKAEPKPRRRRLKLDEDAGG